MKKILLGLLGLTILGGNNLAFAADSLHDLSQRATKATTILDQAMTDPANAIPDSLLRRAQCVFVVPDFAKFGLIIGGQTGKGLVSCRTEKGWSDPSFTNINGGSIGFLVGVEVSDVIIIFTNADAAQQLGKGDFKLSGDASITVGPVGKNAQIGTDYQLKSGAYSYTRSRGAYAGVSLDGSVISPSEDDNHSVYGRESFALGILTTADPNPPAAVLEFLKRLEKLSHS